MRRALTTPDGTPMCVLVVDDNAATRRVIVAILSRLGCRSDVAVDGDEAVDMFGHLQYDCILMDCQLPGMDGYAATQAIRGLESKDRRVHIVAVTSSGLPEDRQRAFDAGMDDYMQKPILIDELAAVLRRGTSEPSSYSLVAPVELAVISDAALLSGVERFLREMMEMQDDVSDIIREFVRQGIARLDEIRAAATRKDGKSVRNSGHSLKGSLSYLGVGEITAMCRMLEKQGSAVDVDSVIDIVDQIGTALTRIGSALERRST